MSTLTSQSSSQAPDNPWSPWPDLYRLGWWSLAPPPNPVLYIVWAVCFGYSYTAPILPSPSPNMDSAECNSAHPYKMLAKQRCYVDYYVKEIDVDNVRWSWPAVRIFMISPVRVYSAGDKRQSYQSHILDRIQCDNHSHDGYLCTLFQRVDNSDAFFHTITIINRFEYVSVVIFSYTYYL